MAIVSNDYLRRPRRAALIVALSGVLASSAVLAAAPSAPAATDSWSCAVTSAVRCYGSGYVQWLQVINGMSATSSEVCAKMITAAGNQRTPWNTNSCSYNTTAHRTCFGGGPDARAYVYWAGAGTTRTVNGWSTSSTPCD